MSGDIRVEHAQKSEIETKVEPSVSVTKPQPSHRIARAAAVCGDGAPR